MSKKVARKKALGRGLGNLIAGGVTRKATASPKAEKTTTPPGSDFLEVPVKHITPNPYQPRRDINPDQLHELQESIRSEGLLQPVVVRQVEDKYQLIAGERRWRACQALGMQKIPVRVIKASDISSAALGLIENLQRADLNPIEESLGYASLMKDFDLTQDQVAERVGKSRAGIANALRLLQFDEEVRGFLASGLLSVGHAKVLLGVEDPGQRNLLARRIIEDGSSVRQTEVMVRKLKESQSRKTRVVQKELEMGQDAHIEALEQRLRDRFKTNVLLKHSPKKGKIIIEYFSPEDLDRLLEELKV